AKKYAPQEKPEWCWAACVSMLFAYYHHPVSQERIVKEVYGAPVNRPSGPGFVLASLLNRTWKDDHGDEFHSRLIGVFDPMFWQFTLDNVMLVRALEQAKPLIMGVGGHAVVLTAVDYLPTPMSPTILGAGVFDPWPGMGARRLSPRELFPVT